MLIALLFTSYGQEVNSKTEEKEKNNYNMNMTSDTLRKVMKSR